MRGGAVDGARVRGNWVFLGPNGVGKGIYGKYIARLVGVPHISTGDLVRAELKRSGSPHALQVGLCTTYNMTA